jgi:SAM-dependent methyltransferase
MHINHLYQLKIAEDISNSRPKAQILDYGCAEAKLVKKGRELGLDVYGVDKFYKPTAYKRDLLESEGLLGNIIKDIINEKIDFEDNYFDLVLSNQVFEHVEDLSSTLKEISRVMKKKGLILCIFPDKWTIFEKHTGVPFIHWFSKKSSIRFHYTLILRRLGIGFHKNNTPKIQWTIETLDYIDKFTHYRSKKKISNIFSEVFDIRFITYDNIRFRLNKNKILRKFAFLYRHPSILKLISILMQPFSSMAILGIKKK